MSAAARPFYLGDGADRRFCIHFLPTDCRARAGMVFVPPFAEEMNKSRRMVAEAARALAVRGVAVLAIDLLGTGDSPGDLSDADWNTWRHDIVRACGWLQQHIDCPVGLWGLRLGAILATAALPQLDCRTPLLLWHPVVAGSVHLTQFLRLKVAADAIGNNTRQTTQQLMAQLAAGGCVEVAGYSLPGRLAVAMSLAALNLPPQYSGRVHWFDLSAASPPELMPASRARIDEWRQRDVDVKTAAVAGPPFWQTQEIDMSAALIEASAAVSSELACAPG